MIQHTDCFGPRRRRVRSLLFLLLLVLMLCTACRRSPSGPAGPYGTPDASLTSEETAVSGGTAVSGEAVLPGETGPSAETGTDAAESSAHDKAGTSDAETAAPSAPQAPASSSGTDVPRETASDDAPGRPAETGAGAPGSGTRPAETANSTQPGAVTPVTAPETAPETSPETSPAGPETAPPVTEPETAPPPADITVTISIDCLTILDHMDMLTPGYESFVPADGWVLHETSLTLPAGSTVETALRRAAGDHGIALETRSSLGSVYVAAIAQLGEKICGQGSGWYYFVNGVSPMTGCSRCELHDGDAVRWRFTCLPGDV